MQPESIIVDGKPVELKEPEEVVPSAAGLVSQLQEFAEYDVEASVDDDIWGTLEVRTPFSPLINDVMESHSGKGVEKALDVLITLNENVNTDQHKARTWQQIARLIAYEIGMKKIPKQDPQLARIYKLIGSSHHLNELPTKGFEVAHLVIDQAIKLQGSHIHHLVTKGAIFRAELQEMEKNCSGATEEVTAMIKKSNYHVQGGYISL